MKLLRCRAKSNEKGEWEFRNNMKQREFNLDKTKTVGKKSKKYGKGLKMKEK